MLYIHMYILPLRIVLLRLFPKLKWDLQNNFNIIHNTYVQSMIKSEAKQNTYVIPDKLIYIQKTLKSNWNKNQFNK